MALDEIRTTWSPRVLSILRMMAAMVLLQFPLAKLFGWPVLAVLNNTPRFSLNWFAACIELVGGALLLVGLYSRCTAFALSGLMAFAYFLGHAHRGFTPLLNGGNQAILFCFIFLYLAFAGGGAWSVDALIRKKT
jgi:putative oxidoreductase